jgi:predicted metal-dependent phosphoesterase TrpH
MRIELHCHSTCSDGTEPVAQVVARAVERKVEVFALTDHDSCDGSDVEVAGVRVIRATELSCDDHGRTIHVLAYERSGGFAPILDRLATQRTARANRLRVMGAKLAQRGVKLDLEPLFEASKSRSVGRPDLARAMVASGVASSMKDAFSRHLYDRGPVDVPHTGLSLADALAAGRACGAALSLAHPHLYDDHGERLLRQHHATGLGGVEAFYGVYDPRERARWTALADELGLVCTGGSDWHGPESNCLIGVELPPDREAKVLAWLAA